MELAATILVHCARFPVRPDGDTRGVILDDAVFRSAPDYGLVTLVCQVDRMDREFIPVAF